MSAACNIRAIWILKEINTVCLSRKSSVVERRWRTSCNSNNDRIFSSLPCDSELADAFLNRRTKEGSARGSDSSVDDPITSHIIGLYINKERDDDKNLLWPIILHIKGHYSVLVLPLVELKHVKAYESLCKTPDRGSSIDLDDSLSSSITRAFMIAHTIGDMLTRDKVEPNVTPAKTPVQSRHKMTLPKRYRTEIQRARSLPHSRFNSPWVHFKLMDSKEKGPSLVKSENNDSDSADDDDEDHDQDLCLDIKNSPGSNTRSINKLYKNGFGGGIGGGFSGGSGGGSGGFRIRYPPAQPESKFSSDQKYNPNPNLNQNYHTPLMATATKVLGNKRERDPLTEVVSAIKLLSDGFVRMEQKKIETVREIKTMRMEMEMKCTEMILESQQRIVEAFTKAVSDDSNNNSNKMMKPINKRIPSLQQP